MPEQPPRTRRLIQMLGAAAAGGSVIRVSCGNCGGRRHYMADDLAKIFDPRTDIHTLARKMKCEGCGRKDEMDVEPRIPAASERAAMTIRRLVEIRIRKIPVWRDEPP